MFQDNVSAEVSYHMARPATVVSNNSNNSNISHTSGGSVAGSPATTGEATNTTSPTSTGAANTGGGMNLEWTSLVDTATKAIQDTGPDTAETEASVDPVTADAQAEAGDEKASLLARVSRLEAELRAEREERAGLQQRVEHLQEENVRLKEESQTAAQQLRRFTEWFFQTIDKS